MARKEETASKKKEKTGQENGSGNSGNFFGSFFKGTKEELDKVVWPSRQQLVSESVAVLLMVILSATIIYLVDELFSWAAGKVFG
ncbi:MAG: preprotein translocase subunit SecE [Okeania sp. SIO2H7]|nr:preprotein translocase subunit SecE [Okeania sp. SIO2H7]